jgi:hypothetical protein
MDADMTSRSAERATPVRQQHAVTGDGGAHHRSSLPDPDAHRPLIL